MVHKGIRFNIRLAQEDKQLLQQVAQQMHRTMSDSLRILVLEKAVDLALIPPLPKEFDTTDDPLQTN
ncbi:MAG: hypothetical protein IPL78_08125 [Chloroflexi bacterium]|nr:hypothetical protein [Chloroflexota bacterium]